MLNFIEIIPSYFECEIITRSDYDTVPPFGTFAEFVAERIVDYLGDRTEGFSSKLVRNESVDIVFSVTSLIDLQEATNIASLVTSELVKQVSNPKRVEDFINFKF